MTLPPGQHRIDDFPRFGTHLHEPPPAVPTEPEIEIGGAAREPLALPLTELSNLPRRELTADFHCVAGWSATGLRWEGVPFAAFYATLQPEPDVSHVRFEGMDGHWSVALLEDVLADDVLLAENLNGAPLDADHGAPLRLVSPGQYGFVNTKHLCRIELLTSEPRDCFAGGSPLGHAGIRLIGYKRFTRARVAQEERHRFLPPAVVRHFSRVLIPPIRRMSNRSSAA